MSSRIWQLVFDDPLMTRIPIEPTSSPVITLDADETTPWGSSGIQAKWRIEASQMMPTKLVEAGRQLRVNELYAFVLCTEEILEDAPRLNDRLNTKAPAAIRWKLIDSFVSGNGVGKPLGWNSDNYAGRISVTRAVANQIAVADITKMYERLLVLDGPDASFWLTNRATIPQLMATTIGNQPVWLPPSNSIKEAPGGFLMGYPVVFSDHAETLGTAGDIQLINPAGYLAVQRGQTRQDSSIHLYFDYAITAFRWIVRFGGMPLLNAAVSPAKGNSRSAFVRLAA
jgi:HK97 family phage major capsid protein